MFSFIGIAMVMLSLHNNQTLTKVQLKGRINTFGLYSLSQEYQHKTVKPYQVQWERNCVRLHGMSDVYTGPAGWVMEAGSLSYFGEDGGRSQFYKFHQIVWCVSDIF